MQHRKIYKSFWKNVLYLRWFLKPNFIERVSFSLKSPNLNKKAHIDTNNSQVGCLFICVQVFGDTIREVSNSSLF
jgi:hypothetical protein